ncbi:cell wall-active antibiotics response protein LiaF [Cytobacillus sp. FJAT-54145]|uniref:Cell wall-active antibiotics response protein LiaF n=1 Tax=Cytobacillus spartinae TaxID=3299023 RepID=A0ABW6KB38_9BACI
MTKIKSDFISWALLIGIIVLLLEVSFFNRGLIFSLLVSIGMVYIGRKWMPRTSGKLLFWVGIIFFSISIFNMMTFKFFLLALLVHLLIQFAKSRKEPERIRPIVKEPNIETKPEGTLIKKKPLFDNVIFGEQRTPEHVYEWNDVNIQTGIGDTVIDLSYTVLPKGETTIIIRKLIGNVTVLIPYDVELSINHSILAGSTNILNYMDEKMYNQTVQIQTPEYDNATHTIKIYTSMMVGDIEVKRV